MSPFAGRLAARYGVKTVLQAGLALAAAGLATVGISANLAVLTAVSVLFVAGIAITVPTLITLIGSMAGAERRAAVTLYTFILFIGATLGPIAASNLLRTGSYIATFETLAAFLAVALCASCMVKFQTSTGGTS
ncbi:MAG TPA: MFS transporter [Paenibacillus sp.]|uniref:MFS transporter n=1 Tax=Paenibacillus sp. TaxID=58172 RepID=UPI002CC5C25C|nr:MFS transporter [Paenibacillus sp.]HUC93479.1 MFS transporter [Paenibacillus sp.]